MNEQINEWIHKLEQDLENQFKEADRLRAIQQRKVLEAFHHARFSSSDFHWNTGYGYGDVGREKVELIFSHLFEAEDALVRPSITSGTHAISLALTGLLQHGDELIYITGMPYDTLQKVIGCKGNEPGNLIEKGIGFSSIELLNQSAFDVPLIIEAVKKKPKVVAIQRSKGYSTRRTLTILEIEKIISQIKQISPQTVVMVDNCYGEFTEELEPSQVGADITVGSLIKNLGGGIALSGGYLVGKRAMIDRIANHLTAPGLGKETGLTFGTTRTTLQGLFYAPMAINNALKGAMLFAECFDRLGFAVYPANHEKRSDIVQAITFNDSERLIRFVRSIQAASIIDAHVIPYPWDMPGYSVPVIMASGSFVEGSSIEISADAPLREPFTAYYQGGISYDQCRFALEIVVLDFLSNEDIHLRDMR